MVVHESLVCSEQLNWALYTHIYIYMCVCVCIIYTQRVNFEHVTIFLSKYISKGAVDMKFSPDVGNKQPMQSIQRKQNK